MALLTFQLKALGCPHVVDLSNTEATRKIVIWLENLKIREYKIEDRKALADLQSSSWDAAFKKYLQDLQCPVPPGDLAAALHWLVAFAINLDYEDNADKLAARNRPPPTSTAPSGVAAGPGPGSAAASGHGAVRPAGGSSSTTGPSTEVFSDLSDPRVAAAVLQLLRAAGCAAADGGDGSLGAAASEGTVERLQAAVERLVGQVGPALQPGVWSPGRPAKQVLAEVPLGFEVEGEALSTAATALRLLYIRDLRHLQSQIDHAVVEMQEYTANPKTDASLGKVGR